VTFQQIQTEAKQNWETFSAFARPRILIGAATCGLAAGAGSVRKAFEKALAERSIEVDIVEVGCLGMCYAEPLVEIGLPGGSRVLYKNVNEETATELVYDVIRDSGQRPDLALCTLGDSTVEDIPAMDDLPMMAGQVRVVMRNAGSIDPTSIEHYVARGGYSGLVRALGMKPEEVIDEVKNSGLRGRGGAGFPTATKWELARASAGDSKYVICNADEGDPGAFMDRLVLESDPHAVLEGLAIAAYAIGASHGFIYARAEYPLAVQRLEKAIGQMKEHGFIGQNIMDSGFDLSLRIKEGAGAFVCGEETALMASVEGRRGMPMPRPPFPTDAGLHEKPTVINNVETLANVSAILERGAGWYAQYGTEKSKGTKTFALAGTINRTGLIEVPMGIPLKEVIFDIGGGIPGNKKFKAVQTGGPSGGCLPASCLDLPVDYECLAEAGAIMGSGGMIVMDEDSCMVDIARYFLEFTHNESCGKCTPCRMGSQHLLRLLTEITDGNGTPTHLEALKRIGETVRDGSLCGLGQTAPNPVLTAVRYFTDEYLDHIRDHRCLAGVCTSLLTFSIDAELCTGCTACSKVCPPRVISGEKKAVHTIDESGCIKCGACFEVCTFDAVKRT